MAGGMKTEDLETYRHSLTKLRARLRGDLDQLTDEALKRNGPESSGNLSNVPLHMADVGTDSFDQEFTLGLIESEATIVEAIDEALRRISGGTFGKCVSCGGMIAKPRLQALPYARHCIDCARKQEGSRP